MRKLHLQEAGLLLSVFLYAVFVISMPATAAVPEQETPADAAAVTQNYPRDPTSEIKWTGAGDSVAVIEAQFNRARSLENGQLGTLVKPLAMPSQAQWDAMNGGQKALWLINEERTARGLLPLDSVEKNATEVAQAYADYLLVNNKTGHFADGSDPWKRLNAKPAIAACHDFLGVAENLAYRWSNFATPDRIAIERAIYNWMYDDRIFDKDGKEIMDQTWGHRHALLWNAYNNNSGRAETEGLIGLGHARGAHTNPKSGIRYPNTDIVVLNLFDPCASWTYAAPPVVKPPPDPEPVKPPAPQPNTAKVSGKTRQPAWVTITSQFFDASPWPGNWEVSVPNKSTNGDYAWGLSNCVPGGDLINPSSRTGRAVGGGVHGSKLACSDPYPHNARSWMIYGPFSLKDAIAADVRVNVWVHTEPYKDMLCILASTDKRTFNGPCVSGSSVNEANLWGWVSETLDLNRVYRMGSLLGRDKVWVALAFITDDKVNRDSKGQAYWGAYADRLVLSKGVIGAAAAGEGEGDVDAAAASPLAGVRITAQNGAWAMTDANGNFTLPNLSKTRHVLTPSKEGFQFYPPTITVDLSKGDVTNVAFVGSSSIHDMLYIPTLRSPRRPSTSAEELAVTDASFQLECGAEGCTLIGPLDVEDGLP